MSVAKRIIPCLDVDKGRVVKGTNFVDIIDAGDPVEIAQKYDYEGADEITFLDITASHEGRNNILSVVERVADEVFIPLTVGGGVKKFDDIRNLLSVGADKVTINTAAVNDPNIINNVTDKIGRQCIVIAVDVKKIDNDYIVFTHGGRTQTDLKAFDWCLDCQQDFTGAPLLTVKTPIKCFKVSLRSSTMCKNNIIIINFFYINCYNYTLSSNLIGYIINNIWIIYCGSVNCYFICSH
jgi:cyclase